MDIQFVLTFLEDLAKHNKKEWMDDNKKRYLEAKEIMTQLVADILDKTSRFDSSVSSLEAKKTLFRINRDVRFSKNKDPYKINFGAFMVEGGKKSGNPGYYLHLEPGNSFYGGGIYQPSAEILQKVRQEIDYNGKELRGIIENKSFKSTYGDPYGNDRLKTAPKGYPKDHEDLDLLQLKHYVFMKNAGNTEVLDSNFTSNVAAHFKILYPFNQYLNQALD